MRAMLGVLVLCACAHGPPPRQLVTAQQDYESARAISAGDDIAAAGNALAVAQRELRENGDTVRARDLAYVASRKADIAKANARAEMDKRRAAMLSAEAAVLRQQQKVVAEAVAPVPPPPPGLEVAVSPQLPTDEEQHETEASQASAAATSAEAPSPAAQGRAMPVMRPAISSTPPRRDAPPLPSFSSFAEVKDDPRGPAIVIPASLMFKPGAADLTAPGQPRLDEIADALKQRDHRISIEVHTDNLAGGDANVELSTKRAQAVRDYLLERGVSPDRIDAKGLGDSKPLVENDTPEHRATNRRVEIVLLAR